jgi:hypothetical protein
VIPLLVIGGVLVLLTIGAAVTVTHREATEAREEWLERRWSRFEELETAADRLRDGLGREPTVREIYEAADVAEPLEPPVGMADGEDLVAGLQWRVSRIMEFAEATNPSVGAGE